jgi:serine/threonine protein phosphatase PrpC
MKKKDYFNSVLHKETGERHLAGGKGCEDSVYTSFSKETGVKTISLSDGAGSYSNAAIGSEITSEVSAEVMTKDFELLYGMNDAEAARYIISKVRKPLENKAKLSGNDLISYSATLLSVAMHPDGRFIAFHIGDGVIVGYSPEAGCKTISIYEHMGPSNQTTFVTIDDTEYNYIKGRNDYSAFVLMSDGPEEFLVNKTEMSFRVQMMIELAYFISESAMKEQLASLISFLKEKGMTDDASFALIANKQVTSQVFSALSPQMLDLLFESDGDIGSKRLKKIRDVLDIISLCENGASLQQIYRRLHVHSAKIAKKKLNCMTQMQLIEFFNGKYYIAR